METSRKYWVVPPSVHSDPRTVNNRRGASVKWKAAFMGWRPDEDRNPLGPKFTNTIQPGGTTLIPRGFREEPETVRFLKTRRIWKYRECRKQFSVKTGTIFAESPIVRRGSCCIASVWLSRMAHGRSRAALVDRWKSVITSFAIFDLDLKRSDRRI